MAFELVKNGAAVTTLNGGINNSQTSIVVSSSTPFPISGNFRIRIEDELLLVTAVTGTTWTVTRAVESTVAASHSSGVTVDYTFTAEALQRWRADNVMIGTWALHPSAMANGVKKGMLYICSDAPYILRYNGSNWDTYGPIYPSNKPDLSSFTKLETSTSATIAANNGSLILPGNGASYSVLYYLPSVTWSSIVVAINSSPRPSESYQFGIIVRDSSNGKFKSFGFAYRNSLPGLSFDAVKWDALDTVNTGYFTLLAQLPKSQMLPSRKLYIKVTKASSDLNFYQSTDGIHWWILFVVAEADFCNPDQPGFFFNNNHASLSMNFNIWHYDRT